MIHLMLNDLCRPSSEVLCARLHIQDLILHLDGLISLALTGAAKKRQTAFLGVVRAVLLDDLGIEHTVYVGARPLSSKNAMMRLRTPIIFAAMPTQLSLYATSVSSRSCATCKSYFVATSDFPARNIGSCISSFIMFLPFNLYYLSIIFCYLHYS